MATLKEVEAMLSLMVLMADNPKAQARFEEARNAVERARNIALAVVRSPSNALEHELRNVCGE